MAIHKAGRLEISADSKGLDHQPRVYALTLLGKDKPAIEITGLDRNDMIDLLYITRRSLGLEE